jgi:hypothetical protein
MTDQSMNFHLYFLIKIITENDKNNFYLDT